MRKAITAIAAEVESQIINDLGVTAAVMRRKSTHEKIAEELWQMNIIGDDV